MTVQIIKQATDFFFGDLYFNGSHMLIETLNVHFENFVIFINVHVSNLGI